MQKCLLTNILFFIPILMAGQTFSTGEKTITCHDSLRNRQIRFEIWYPTYETDSTRAGITDLPFILDPTIRNAGFIQQKFPLILLSHGTGGNRFSLAWLAIFLAKNGYIVAAPDHWGNTYDNKIPEYFVRYWERPLDISFLLTHILNDKTLSPYIDSARIGMAGFSFGGYTTLALAGADLDCSLLKKAAETPEGKKEFNVPELGDLRKLIRQIPCGIVPKTFKDRRIKAFVAMSPAAGLGFQNTEQTRQIKSPVLIIGAESDRIAPVKTNAGFYHKLIHDSDYILLQGKVGHYVFLNVGNEDLKKEAKKYYLDDKTVDREKVHMEVENDIIRFFRKSLQE
jgi:predicted dienelactone hydrolase